jgi:hypothetical protein
MGWVPGESVQWLKHSALSKPGSQTVDWHDFCGHVRFTPFYPTVHQQILIVAVAKIRIC